MTAPVKAADLIRHLTSVAEAQADENDQGGGLSSEEQFEQRVTGMLGELLDTDALDSIAPLEPVVVDMLFRDTLARIYGLSGTFKSFMTLDTAACVATGIPWHGQTTRPSPVVYLVVEGLRGIRKRVRAWE
ncbi:AAA family ATPase [Streptomyces sp. NRRL S-813]|uniref:AAA family ATPase n=1 Tax=Streptomyces sp. NRRL S-813 TaxID=1463919 RepID=UPI0004BFC11E|nr:AAA family ATPase [Streptomyces sp. NRRL S-813]